MGKIKNFLNKHFYKIFSDSHLFYTIIFFVAAFLIAVLSLIPLANVGNIVLFLSTSISLSYIILMFIGLIPALKDFLFSEEKIFDKNKILGFLGAYLVSFLITIIYFIFGPSTNLTVEFLGWDVLLPALFIIIFFGWNLLQIIFLRSGMETISEKIEDKLLPVSSSLGKKQKLSLLFLVIAVIIPPLLQIALIFAYAPSFSSGGGIIFTWFVVVIIGMFIIIAMTTWRIITLYIRSKNNETPNIFSSFFYIFIWLYISYRAFSFLNSLRGEANVGADIFTALIDVLLVVLTAILVLRSLGGKVFSAIIFNKNNMPFFLYAFTMLYIQGQIIMITGAGNLVGVFSNQNQVDLVNNFLIIIITFGFYIWYSSYSLQRKGLIQRTLFTQEEIVNIIMNYRKHLEKLGYVDSENLTEAELKSFLEKQKISPEDVFEEEEEESIEPEEVFEQTSESESKKSSDITESEKNSS